ncbi:MAG: hypothetical protein J6D03_09980 [Clostridia bacterium]|nr:hypothetical protein [Clostridia bacterium]
MILKDLFILKKDIWKLLDQEYVYLFDDSGRLQCEGNWDSTEGIVDNGVISYVMHENDYIIRRASVWQIKDMLKYD